MKVRWCAFAVVLAVMAIAVFGQRVAHAQGDRLLVGVCAEDVVRSYDGVTGAYLGVFAGPGPNPYRDSRICMAWGPNGNLFAGRLSIREYDGATGALVRDVTPDLIPQGEFPAAISFGPDGNLYVGVWAYSTGNHRVRRYNLVTGSPMDDFVPNGSGGMVTFDGLTFGPDGNLYLGAYEADSSVSIKQYDGLTGAYLREAVPAPAGGLMTPDHMVFAPDGTLWIADFYGQRVRRYDVAAGAQIGPTIAVSWPGGLAFSPDGMLYVSHRYDWGVGRYDPRTGAWAGYLIPPNSVVEPTLLLWWPGPEPAPTNRPPVAVAGPPQTVECAGALTDVSLDGTGSSDPDGDVLTYQWLIGDAVVAEGATPTIGLTLGTHSVVLRVSDPDGLTGEDTVTVAVQDTAAPAIAGLCADKASLWPPNHQMVDVMLRYSVTDAGDAAPVCTVTVSSSEPANGLGDGDTAPDWEVVNSHHVRLRAERGGSGPGRTYTITVTCADASGNVATATTTVVVPRSHRP